MQTKIIHKLVNKKTFLFSCVVLLIFSLFPNMDSSLMKAQLKTKKHWWSIVVFSSEVNNSETKEKILKKHNLSKKKNIESINAVLIEDLNESQKTDLLNNPEVLAIDKDIVIQIEGEFKKWKKENTQVIPWWINRMLWEKELKKNYGKRPKVGILDTWISFEHEDLKQNIKWWINLIDSTLSAEDDNGHWTHIAWIIAWVDNKKWIVWIWPKIKLYWIKAFNSSWGAYLSDVLEWIDWAIENKMDILNMSFWTTANLVSLDLAIKEAYDNWITLVWSAWNSSRYVLYPAKYPEVIAVSWTDKNDWILWFSGRWPEIDFTAPWLNIYSSWLNNTYWNDSWTSFSAPHIAWVAWIIMSSKIEDFDNNWNKKWDNDEIKQKLIDISLDLWVPWKDDYYGYWLPVIK